MVPLVENKLPVLLEVCAQFRIKRLELFGSAVDPERFDYQVSDLDFLVEFMPMKAGEHAEAYFGFKETLEKLFDRPVDLVMPKAIRNRYFRQAVNRQRKVLYAA